MTPGTHIGEWPVEERPRERLSHHGAAAMADAALLALQLVTGEGGSYSVVVARFVLVSLVSLWALG